MLFAVGDTIEFTGRGTINCVWCEPSGNKWYVHAHDGTSGYFLCEDSKHADMNPDCGTAWIEKAECESKFTAV